MTVQEKISFHRLTVLGLVIFHAERQGVPRGI